MGYDLMASNKKLKTFRMGLSFTTLLEAANYMFPCVHRGGRYYFVTGVDDRFPVGSGYPSIIANDGFRFTANEARWLARIARNYVEIQKTLPDNPKYEILSVKYIDYPFPYKIRGDWVELFSDFADWADKSRGFKVY